MLLVSLFVTPFSVGQVLGMDEMMLNLVLTVPALIILSFGKTITWGIVLAVWAVNIAIIYADGLPELPQQYLGGYQMAVFWLPILLGGAIIGGPIKWRGAERSMLRQLGIWMMLLAVAVALSGWPDKMRVTAGFGVLSVVVCMVVHYALKHLSLRCRWLEYFGSRPLRMWGLMFCLLGPLRLYGEVELKRAALSFSPLAAVSASLGWMGCCYLISKEWDKVTTAITKKI